MVANSRYGIARRHGASLGIARQRWSALGIAGKAGASLDIARSSCESLDIARAFDRCKQCLSALFSVQFIILEKQLCAKGSEYVWVTNDLQQLLL